MNARNSLALTIAATAMVIAIAALANTSSSSSQASVTATPTPRATATATPIPTPKPAIRVYPQIGVVRWVSRQGHSSIVNPRGSGVRYSCFIKMHSARMDPGITEAYYSTLLTYNDHSIDQFVGEGGHRHLTSVQQYVTLKFGGDNVVPFAKRVRSLIVTIVGAHPSDMRFVNVKQEMIQQGIILNTQDFQTRGAGKIGSVKVCVLPKD